MRNFKNRLLGTIFLMTMICINLNGQTNVSGGIYTNTTWTKANSPYIVVDTVVVFPSVTLTVEPGVVVKVEDGIRLEIRQALLNCQGTAIDSITFTSNSLSPYSGIWDAVFLNGVNAKMIAHYCNFLYAENGIDCFLNYDDTLIVKHSSFRFNKIGIHNEFGSIALIDSSNFKNNTEYGFRGNGSTLNHCYFSNNQNGIYCHHSIILNTRVEYSSDRGIQPNGSTIGTVIDNCEVVHNQYGIVSTGGEAPLGRILNSRIDSNSQVGIMMFGVLKGDTIDNCLIRNNGVGILDTNCISCYGGPDIITHNVIENNTIGIRVNSTLDTIYCNRICNNSSYDFYYNLEFNNNIQIPFNYWCNSDSSTIRSRIYDGYININKGLVDFMPFNDSMSCYTAVNVQTINDFKELKIFPNPVRDRVNIKSEGLSEIIIYDISSRKVLQRQFVNATTLNIAGLESGLYVYELNKSGTIKRGKLIKE